MATIAEVEKLLIPLFSSAHVRGAQVHQEVIDADLVCLLYTLPALLWTNDPQALDNLEITVVCLGNVHVHSNVMLTGHYFSWTTRPIIDLCVV
jgi:hypothetical protein